MTTTGASVEPSSRVARSDPIIFTELDDTVVMMDVEEGRYYELDAMGARVWALAESGPRTAEICAALVAEYEVAPDRCGNEVRAFLNELCRLAVMRILPEDGKIEIANDETRDPERSSISRTSPAAPRPGELEAQRAWTTPKIRVMALTRTANVSHHTDVYLETVGGVTYAYGLPPAS